MDLASPRRRRHRTKHFPTLDFKADGEGAGGAAADGAAADGAADNGAAADGAAADVEGAGFVFTLAAVAADEFAPVTGSVAVVATVFAAIVFAAAASFPFAGAVSGSALDSSCSSSFIVFPSSFHQL